MSAPGDRDLPVSAPVRRDRPDIPASYGIETGDAGLLEWDRVDAALAATVTYWISTTRRSGTPHLIPIWGGWDGSALHVEGGEDTVWARSLAHQPSVAAGADHDGLQIILGGTAEHRDADDVETVAANYASKYPYRPEAHPFWVITPRTVLAWDTGSIEAFARTPTRFHFEEES